MSRFDLVTSDMLRRRARLREAFPGRSLPTLTDQQRLALLPRPPYNPPDRTPGEQTALAERFAQACAADRERVDAEAARATKIWTQWERLWAEYQAGEAVLTGQAQSLEYFQRQRDRRRAERWARKAGELRKKYATTKHAQISDPAPVSVYPSPSDPAPLILSATH